MAEVNEVANESNVHVDFQGIQTTSEPDLGNYFKYLVQASNELYQPTTWEGAKILYKYILNPQLWYNLWKYKYSMETQVLSNVWCIARFGTISVIIKLKKR